jgi:predicted dehydrogenase
MAERIPIAGIGCGGMGRRHLRGMARLDSSSLGNVELVAVCDLSAGNANFLADEARASGVQPEVTLEEGRRDLALTYAPFESGLLGRAVSLDELLSGTVSRYQDDIDARLSLLTAGV